MSGLGASASRLNNWLRFPMFRYPVVSLRNVCQSVLLGSLEGLSYLCQVLVCCIIFPGMIQHFAQQPSRLALVKTPELFPGM